MTTLILASTFWRSFCCPAVLYHGTWSARAQDMLRDGMDYSLGEKQSLASLSGNYLTTSFAMAASIARSRAHSNGGEPVVLKVDAQGFQADNLAFDLNMCGRHWSESVTYSHPIPPTWLAQVPGDMRVVPDEPMLLWEPQPGERPLVFDLAWSRATEFLAALGHQVPSRLAQIALATGRTA